MGLLDRFSKKNSTQEATSAGAADASAESPPDRTMPAAIVPIC